MLLRYALAGLASFALILLASCPEGIEEVTPESLGGPGAVGAECRPADHPDGPCDRILNGNNLVNGVCASNGLCLIDCSIGGTGMCQTALESLACSPTAGNVCVNACVDGDCGDGFACFSSEDVCLPTGAFPGSPCRPDDPDSDTDTPCDVGLAGVDGADMECRDGLCLLICTDGGTGLCKQVNATLTCSPTAGDVCLPDCSNGEACPDGFACFATDGACLPTGAFPGSPCRVTVPECDQNLGGIDGANMNCVNDTCVVDCGTGGQELCQGVSPLLNCSATAGLLCLPGCIDGQCGPGFSCFSSEQNCLPQGSFPGSSCRPDPDNPCDQNVAGVAEADMVCFSDQCVIPCGGGGTALCKQVNSQLTCVKAASNLCLLECGPNGECLDGFSCFVNPDEDAPACLPTGGFPGSPCRTGVIPGTECDKDLGGNVGVNLVCVNDTCLLECPTGADDVCTGLSATLHCSAAAGNYCLPMCETDKSCSIPGLACLTSENSCLPIGAFPGSPCRTDEPRCDDHLGGSGPVHMICTNDTCVIDCRVGGTELCETVLPNLVCSQAAGGACVLACNAGACDTGFSCFSDENVCLPTGAFPGSPCLPAPDECAQDLGGNDAADMICLQGTCVVDCSMLGTALCQGVSPILTCSDAAGGACVKACLGDGTCADAGFSCFSDEQACLPTGAFPGSPCVQPGDGCAQDLGGNDAADMICLQGTCVVDCSTLGTPLCEGVSPILTCSAAAGGACVKACLGDGTCGDAGFSCFGDEQACLPTGAFPGSPCVQPGDGCAQDLGGNDAADMICLQGTCVVDCSTLGTPLCEGVSPILTCSAAAGGACVKACLGDGTCADAGFSCFTDESACLPTGAFPGSPCVQPGDGCAQDLGGNDAADMICLQGTCVVDCSTLGTPLCEGVSPILTCSAAAGGACVKACLGDGTCADAGFSCFATEGTCLPTGAFPGSPCGTGDFCAQDLLGIDIVDMFCNSGTCVVDCAAGGDFLCGLVDPSLSCSAAAGGACLLTCGAGGTCDTGFACFSVENVCLPQGSFPGSPCAGPANDQCASVGGASQVCVQGTCVVDCSAGVGGAAVCGAVDASLTCSAAAGEVCLPGCVDGVCGAGFSCFATEDACLPTGSFPGSPCVGGVGGACAAVGPAAQLCVQGTCLVDCSAGAVAGANTCDAVDPSGGLACSPSAGEVCVLACQSGQCSDGFSCLLSENACLPNGTFPGSKCRSGEFNRCDLNLTGQADIDMYCYVETCQVDCTTAGATVCGLYSAAVGLPTSCYNTGVGSFCALVIPPAFGGACTADVDCVTVGFGAACDLPSGACLPYKPVTILHTNDLHSHFDGVGPSVSPQKGGYAKLTTLVQAAQAAAATRGDVLLTLDGGDFMMGTVYELLAGNVEFDLFAHLGFDATVMGNHELDWGAGGLVQILAANTGASLFYQGATACTLGTTCPSPVPVVASNINFDDDVLATDDDSLKAVYDVDDSDPAKTFKKFHVIDKDGVKVGVFGIMGQDAVDVSPALGSLTFDNIVVESQEMVTLLRGAPHNVDIVIALSHSGSMPPPQLSEDEVVAEQVTGLDIIISGHTHERVEPKMINGTWVVQAGQYSEMLGELHVAYDPINKRIDPNLFDYVSYENDDTVTPDALMTALGGLYRGQIDGILAAAGAPWATTTVNATTTFDLKRTAGVEGGLGNLVADAYRVVVSSIVTLNPADPTPIAVGIEGNGVIRDDILTMKDAGGAPLLTDVTFADLFAVEPLGASPTNTTPALFTPGYPMVEFYITPDELRQVFEVATTLYYLRGSAFWLHISGARFVYDLSAPSFNRVVGIWLDAPAPLPGSVGLPDVCDDTTNILTMISPPPPALIRVTTNLYVAGFAQLLGTLTGGALLVEPKDKDGVVVADITTRIVYPTAAKVEATDLRIWQALASYLDIVAPLFDNPGTTADDPGPIPPLYAAPDGRVSLLSDFAVCP